MRGAIVSEFGGPDKVEIGEMPLPTPGPMQALIEVHAVPVNYVDLVVIAGKYQFMPKLPFTPGKGPAGVVKSIGAGVTTLLPGDRVLAMAEIGGYAEYALASADQCYKLPDGVSFEAAASIAVSYDTAWFALLERARLRSGEAVLVLGATGAVGAAAVQIAKAKGAQVIAGVSSTSKFQAALDAGADHVVDLSMENLHDGLRDIVRGYTKGQGANIVLDPLGGDFFDAALRAIAWRGRLVVIGFAAGRIPTVKVNYLMLKNIEVSGLQISDYRKRAVAEVKTGFEDIFQMLLKKEIHPPSIQVFKLDDAAKALRELGDRTASGRIVLSVR